MRYRFLLAFVLVLTAAAPVTAQSQLSGRIKDARVDLSSVETRQRWVDDWLSSTSALFEKLPPDESAKLSIKMVTTGMKNANSAYARMPQQERLTADDDLFSSTVGDMLPPGNYIAIPADGSPPFAWRMITTREGRKIFDIDPMQALPPAMLAAPQTIQQNQAIQSTSNPEQSQGNKPMSPEQIEKYKKWRNSFSGRMYRVQMGNSGFVPIYDPATGLEKWVPKNSVGVTQF